MSSPNPNLVKTVLCNAVATRVVTYHDLYGHIRTKPAKQVEVLSTLFLNVQ